MSRPVKIISVSGPFKQAPKAFENNEPINDPTAILYLLAATYNDRTKRILVMDHDPPYVEVQQWNGGYTREEYRKSTFYQIDPACIAELQKHELVEGVICSAKVIDPNILRITDAGQHRLQKRPS